jgi:hypothetical protein
MEQWRSDLNLAGVREKDALGELPAEERTGWRKLWADVEALRERAMG